MEDIFFRVGELIKKGKKFALATIVHSDESTPREIGARMIIFPDKKSEGTIGGGILEKTVIEDSVKLLEQGKSERFTYDLGKNGKDLPLGSLCGGKTEVLIEVFKTESKIFIFGAGHIGKKLAEVCRILSLPYWIIDDREEYAKKELFPEAADVIHSNFERSFSQLPIDENSYIIIVTYGHKHDGVCLKKALNTKARYVGMIGSRNKVKILLETLSKNGVNIKDPRIYAPVGLQLGDKTPQEISISIMAEILKIKSGGTGKHWRELL